MESRASICRKQAGKASPVIGLQLLSSSLGFTKAAKKPKKPRIQRGPYDTLSKHDQLPVASTSYSSVVAKSAVTLILINRAV